MLRAPTRILNDFATRYQPYRPATLSLDRGCSKRLPPCGLFGPQFGRQTEVMVVWEIPYFLFFAITVAIGLCLARPARLSFRQSRIHLRAISPFTELGIGFMLQLQRRRHSITLIGFHKIDLARRLHEA